MHVRQLRMSRAAQKINIDIYRNPAHAVLARLKVPNQASCRQFKRSRWFGREINGDQRDRNVKPASKLGRR